ncbi:MAG: MBL fold metallo-hydrolase [Candidatus Buchananbacteria bacterium]
MIITWFGQSCFKLEGQNCALVTDPFDKTLGLKLPKLAANVVTISHQHYDHNNLESVKGVNDDQPFIIEQPGEYEVKNIFIYGINSYHDANEGKDRGSNIIYRIEIDGVSLAHLGDLGHTLTDEQVEKLEGVDILMIPVGGAYTLNAKKATEIISQLEPRVVIPMHYDLPGLKTKSKLDSVSLFCKEIGVCPTETINKFKVTKKDLPQQNLQVVIMQP